MCVGTSARKAVPPDGSSIPSSSRPQTASRRPTSNTIAATPLERIPERFVAEASRLIDRGAAVLDKRLKQPLANAALRRQGVDSCHVVACAAQQGVPVEPREARLALQLLAQVLWEEHSHGSDPLRPYTRPPTLEQRPPKDPTEADLIRAFDVRQNAVNAHHRWREKEKAVEAKRNKRQQSLADESNKWNLKHHHEQTKTDAFKQWREQHCEDRRCEHYHLDRDRGENLAKRTAGQHKAHARERGSSTAARVALNNFNKEICNAEDQEMTTARLEKSGNAQFGAGMRRERALSARASGRPSLHISRELAHLQAARCERLNAEKRLAWYENLENNRSAASGGVTAALMDVGLSA